MIRGASAFLLFSPVPRGVISLLSVFESSYREVSPNPRNLAAGALRQKHDDGKADASDLVFQAYDAKFPV
ncbi:MAG: hypothetical protein QGI36_05030, partial [Candidatus Thalassarchaeaceae archaeon]|nr:hypothetical protein [Candidatus Thalassarchaeaceae archaeon]